MALQKQTIPVDFVGGMDTKTATQSVMPGSFLLIENGVRRRTKLITKRFGFNALSRSISSGGSISVGRRIGRFKDELDLLDNEKLYSYIPAAQEWVDRGKISSVLVDAKPIIRNSATQAMADTASADGLTCTVYEDSRGGVRYSISDDETGAVSVYDQVLDAAGSRPKVVALGNRFILLFFDGTSAIKSRYINTSSPATISAPVTVIGAILDKPWDICAYNSVSAIFAANTSANVLTLGYIDSIGHLGTPIGSGLPNPITLSERGRDAVTILCDTSYIYTTYCDNADFAGLHINGITPDFASQHTATVAGVDTRNVTVVKNAANQFEIYYEENVATDFDRQFVRIFTRTFTYNGTSFTFLTAQSTFRVSAGLASKAFLAGNYTYINVTHQSELQSTYLTIRSDQFIAARFTVGLGGGLTKGATGTLKSGLCACSTNSLNNRVLAAQIANKLIADNDNKIRSQYLGLNLISLSIDNSELISDELGRNYHVAGGVLSVYDGAQVVESGFHFYPENIQLAALAGASSLTAGAYLVSVIFEWVDGQGNIHRSAPSIPQSVTVTGAGQVIQVLTPYLTMTQKSNVKIVIYRTVSGGDSVFYRDTVIDNDPASTYTFTNLTQSDAALSTQEILYTVGGVLDNIAPPSSRIVHKHKNRLFLAGLEDNTSITYSKEYTSGEGIGFSDGFIIQVDPLGGGVTALASLDDKLVIFKKDRIFIMGGDGPLDTGAQNDYPQPQLVSGDVGCDNPNSIAIMPDGLMFKSDKGIYLLNRSVSLEYIGSAVEAYNSLTVSSAVFIENSNEVRFTTSDGPALVYNYFFKQWSVFTNYTANSAVAVLGSYAHLKSDGTVNLESTSYLDNGQKISMVLETSWFNFAGIQSFQRIYRYALLGDFVTHCTTRVKLAYNYEPVYNETVYFNSQTGLMQSVYGDDSTYGDSTVYGGTGSLVYQFRSKPARQKCEAIKLKIEILDNIEPSGGACVNLTNLSFDVGLKGEINRMGGGKNVGSL